MAIIAIAIYGSVARGDNTEISDVDLLAVVEEKPRSKFDKLKTNISYYNESDLIDLAKRGDLFAFHLVSEGVFIYDSGDFGERLRGAFRPKESYADDISKASSLGWFIVKNFVDAIDNFLVNRRAAWCVRTILIAKSVEERRPAFSASSLLDRFRAIEGDEIIRWKNSHGRNHKLPELLSIFLETFGDKEMAFVKDAPLADVLLRFRSEGNKIAQATASAMMSQVDLY